MKVIVGEIGPPGSGKETVGNFITESAKKDNLTVNRHRFSDVLSETLLRLQTLRQNGWTTNGVLLGNVLREILLIWSMENTDANNAKLARTLFAADAFGDGNVESSTPNKQKLAQVMVKGEFGADTLANAVGNRLAKSPTNIVIADGVRWFADEKLLRNLPKKHAGVVSLLLYVTANPANTLARIKVRARDAREMNITSEEWKKINRAKNEIDIPAIGNRADWKIINDGTPEELEEKVREFYEKMVRPIFENKLK